MKPETKLKVTACACDLTTCAYPRDTEVEFQFFKEDVSLVIGNMAYSISKPLLVKLLELATEK